MPSENRTSVFSIDRRETDQHGTFDGGERGRKSRLSNRLANQQGGTGFNVRRSTSDRKNMLLSTHDALNGSAAADLVSSGDESVGKGSVGNGKGKKYGGHDRKKRERREKYKGVEARKMHAYESRNHTENINETTRRARKTRSAGLRAHCGRAREHM